MTINLSAVLQRNALRLIDYNDKGAPQAARSKTYLYKLGAAFLNFALYLVASFLYLKGQGHCQFEPPQAYNKKSGYSPTFSEALQSSDSNLTKLGYFVKNLQDLGGKAGDIHKGHFTRFSNF